MTIIDSIIEMASSRVSYERKRSANKKPYKVCPELNPQLAELRKNGFIVIENYYDDKKCSLIRDEIDLLNEKYKDSDKLQIDKFNSDRRIFGAEKSELIKDFYNDEFCLNIVQNYFGGKICNSNTLAGKLVAQEGNLGSGQGWHRDAHHFQFKAIIYLSDVEITNGPFQIIKGSHHSAQALKDMQIMKVNSQTTRYTNEQVEKVIKKRPEDYKVLTAKAGTLVLADTSAIHTGKPIENGTRYTLFNYYYPSYDNIENRRKQFNCIGE